MLQFAPSVQFKIITPRWYQIECVNAIVNYFNNGGTGNPVCALPTGTGKSVCIAMFNEWVIKTYPGQRIMNLTHVKELIQQNSEELLGMWPNAPVGIYSSALNRKEHLQPIIFGGVASVVHNVALFGRIDLLIIDECHLLSPTDETMYRKVIANLMLINPCMKVIGFTATPYRQGQGMITEAVEDKDGNLMPPIFTDICYNITDITSIARLVNEGFLSPLVARPTNVSLDLTGVSMRNGDFAPGQLERAIDKEEITRAAVLELIRYGQDRISWLVFASGVEHCDHVAEMLQDYGIAATSIHSKLKGNLRDERFKAFKEHRLRCIVGNNIFTTGFNHRAVDLIGMLRPTTSTGLWVQMLGRGTRPSPETNKVNCLVLDFAKNTKNLGPMDDPVIPRKKGKGTGEAPIKICEYCDCYNHISARICFNCFKEFAFETKLVKEADNRALMKSQELQEWPVIETYYVTRVLYNRVQKENGPPKIRASYYCGSHKFEVWISLQDTYGLLKSNARTWWRQAHATEPPLTTDEALQYISELRTPVSIKVYTNKKPLPEILSYEY